MLEKLKSRKFLLALAGALLFLLNDQLGWGMSRETLDGILKFFGLFILAEGGADIATRLRAE